MKESDPLKNKIEAVTLTYDLFDLPTAQHKAGLAGLILQIRSMTDRRVEPESIPTIEGLTPTSATIRFTQRSIQGLFDDLYDSEFAEVAVEKKWADEQPKRVEETRQTDPSTGKTRIVKRFVYEVVQPCGHFLRQHYPDGDGQWLKLWRDMLWDVPRGKPTTRLPYKSRAAGQPCAEGQTVWKELLGFVKDRTRNVIRTCEVASALLLGAQARSAECVPFRGRSDHTLLLHFWPLTTMIFVPRQIDNEGKADFVGYTLAIPEVANLEEFCRIYPRMLAQLDTATIGYRPRAAVIDIPQQAGLEFLEHMALLADQAARRMEIINCLAAIEYMHLVNQDKNKKTKKKEKNVKLMASGRIVSDDQLPHLLDQYLALLGRDRDRFRNPLFRAGVMLALLEGKPWYLPMRATLMERPWPLFVRSEKTPAGLPWFAADVSKKFQDVSQDYQEEVEAMSEIQNLGAAPDRPKPRLERLVYRLIQNYVRRKTEEKCGIRWEDFKDNKVKDENTGKERINIPREYQEAREKVVSDGFLAMRSRREQDFVDYFTATVCSVAQFLPEDEFCVVAKALLEEPEKVKTLALLAFSASSL